MSNIINFFSEIIKNGCSIKCYYDLTDDKSDNLFLITSYNPNLKPVLSDCDKENELFSLLIGLLVVKFSNDINDPFNFDFEDESGAIVINNEPFKIKLPFNISKLFLDGDLDTNITDKICESILRHNNVDISEITINLLSIKYEVHNISVIKNRKRIPIGVGAIFN
jgi:hypothetical protein